MRPCVDVEMGNEVLNETPVAPEAGVDGSRPGGWSGGECCYCYCRLRCRLLCLVTVGGVNQGRGCMRFDAERGGVGDAA